MGMKIVQLDSHVSWRGGEQQVLYLSQYLHACGYDCVVVCPPHSALYARAQEAGIRTRALPMRYEGDVLAVWRLGCYLRQQRVDILHMHTPHAHTIGLLASLWHPGVRQVVSRRVDFPPGRNVISRWKYLRPAVQYVAVSHAVQQILIASGIAAGRVRTIYSGIDLHRIDDVEPAAALFPAGTQVVGTVGHLAGHKGHRYLLEATQYLLQLEPRSAVVIVGDGKLRATLEAQAASLGIAERVCFTGFRRDVLALMQQFEVFVFSSYLEGLGTALLDAMALRKPVVATCAGGIPEAVQDGVTGILVPPRQPQALAQAVHQLLRHPEQRQRFGEAGRKRVEQCFTAQRMAAQTLQLYRRLLNHEQ
jgi:glycosyltransferase involved in cell wall biosynthesis